jgi:hypothetical protein
MVSAALAYTKLFTSYQCIDVPGGINADGTHLQIWTCTQGNTNQVWTSLTGGVFQWSGTNKCIDLTNGNTAPGTVLQIFTCASGLSQPNQRWKHITPSTNTECVTLFNYLRRVTLRDANHDFVYQIRRAHRLRRCNLPRVRVGCGRRRARHRHLRRLHLHLPQWERCVGRPDHRAHGHDLGLWQVPRCAGWHQRGRDTRAAVDVRPGKH